MVCDEAPAATASGVNNVESDRSEPAWPGIALLDSGNGPISFVAAEIHLGRDQQASATGWRQCNIQVACQTLSDKISRDFRILVAQLGALESSLIAISSSPLKI
jgi:hypothetical protein